MSVSLEVVNGVGPAMAEMLKSNGFNSVEDLANTSVETLVDLPGFGPSRATLIILRANEALAQLEAETAAADLAEPASAEDTAAPIEYDEEQDQGDIAEAATSVIPNEDDIAPETAEDGVLAAEELSEDAESAPEPVAALIDDQVNFSAAEEDAGSVWDNALVTANGKEDEKKATKKRKKVKRKDKTSVDKAKTKKPKKQKKSAKGDGKKQKEKQKEKRTKKGVKKDSVKDTEKGTKLSKPKKAKKPSSKKRSGKKQGKKK